MRLGFGCLASKILFIDEFGVSSVKNWVFMAKALVSFRNELEFSNA